MPGQLGRSGESTAADLAAASDHDLVRRLNLCDEQDRLLNAGAILLCSGQAAIDYRRREVAGADVSYRVHREGRSLLEQLTAVIDAIQLNNRRVELGFHWAHGQVHRIPNPAAREALVNGITHRDWESTVATEVEHVGDRLSVTSPGGFVGGVSPTNIITHPSTPRYPRLAQALTALRIAERQGIGVDRMHREMLVLGLPSPIIEEIPGPSVRTVLLGGEPEDVWLRLLTSLDPPSASRDLEFLLILDLATRTGWVTGDRAAPLVQRSRGETSEVLRRLATVRWPTINQPVFVPVTGDPRVGRDPYDAAWQLHDLVRRALDLVGTGRYRLPDRETLLFDYARQRDRISSREAASLLATTSNTARSVLEDLVRQGRLRPNRENRRDRGFAYLPIQVDGLRQY